MIMLSVRKPRYLVLIGILITVGIVFSPFVCPVYWDEIPQYRIGEYNFNQYAMLADRIFGTSMSDPAWADFEHFGDRDYGSVFEVLVSGLGRIAGKILPGFGLAELIILKHFAVYLVFLFGTYGVFSMARQRLGNVYGGLFAAAIFFLSPRLFGNAFYNSKDIVFLSFFALSVSYILLAAYKPKASSVLLAALFTASAASTRIIGLFSLFLGVFVWFVCWRRNHGSIRKIYAAIGCYVLLTFAMIYVSYPFLWPAPVSRLCDVIAAMSKFSRHPDLSLFDGKWIRASAEPFYLLGWMAVTLPFMFIIATLFGQLSGLTVILKRTFSLSLWKNSSELCDYITTGLGITPVLLSVVKPQYLYDGWRHFYFLMPFLSVSAAVGIFKAASFCVFMRARTAVAVWLGSSAVIESILGIIWFFPYPNCYFNASAGSNLIARYDLDYAETSAYEALIKVLSDNPTISEPIKIASASMDLSIISPRLGQSQKLFDFGENFLPDYIITKGAELSDAEKQFYREIHVIRTTGGVVLARILVPNENRDSVCRLEASRCAIR